MNSLTQMNRRLFDDVNSFSRHTGWLHAPMAAYATYGVLLFGLLLLIGLYISRRGDARMLAAAVWAGAAVLLAVALNQPIVHLVNEARPFTGHPGVLVLVSRSADASFPSDHASMAGAAATGLLLVSRRLGLVTVGLAMVMAFARVYVGVHYPGDVLVGLLVGAVVAGLGWRLLRVPLIAAAEWLRSRRQLKLLLGSDDEPAYAESSPV